MTRPDLPGYLAPALLCAALSVAPFALAQQGAGGPPADNPYMIYATPPQATPLPFPFSPPPPPATPAPVVPVLPVLPVLPKVVEPVQPTLSDLGRSLRNYFTADELDLLFAYMKESVIASFKGEEVSLPPDLAFKLEILLVRLQKEGGQYMDNLIKQLERDLKNSLKEKLAPPGETTEPPPAAPQRSRLQEPKPNLKTSSSARR